MKYKTVQIRPNLGGEWEVIFSVGDGQDRVKGKKCTPNAMGFYHYWETIPDDVAFSELKSFMIKRHKDEINKLMESLAKLQKITLE